MTDRNLPARPSTPDTPVAFDAADLAEAILGTEPPTPPTAAPSPPPVAERHAARAMGWALLVALIAAVSIAVSLAVQLQPEAGARPQTPPCGGLYSSCCDDVGEHADPCFEPCEQQAVPDRDEPGLFDAEEEFAHRRPRPGC